ncbi:MAG: hypothetical protein V4623_01850 [Pseudomonadota bacterium]
MGPGISSAVSRFFGLGAKPAGGVGEPDHNAAPGLKVGSDGDNPFSCPRAARGISISELREKEKKRAVTHANALIVCLNNEHSRFPQKEPFAVLNRCDRHIQALSRSMEAVKFCSGFDDKVAPTKAPAVQIQEAQPVVQKQETQNKAPVVTQKPAHDLHFFWL